MANNIDVTAHSPCRVYKHRDVFWIPHYTKRNFFVAPGGATCHVSYLEQVGAEFVHLSLWIRPWAVAAGVQKGLT